jgi:hypothetical protein
MEKSTFGTAAFLRQRVNLKIARCGPVGPLRRLCDSMIVRCHARQIPRADQCTNFAMVNANAADASTVATIHLMIAVSTADTTAGVNIQRPVAAETFSRTPSTLQRKRNVYELVRVLRSSTSAGGEAVDHVDFALGSPRATGAVRARRTHTQDLHAIYVGSRTSRTPCAI